MNHPVIDYSRFNKGPLFPEQITKYLEFIAYVEYEDGGEWYHLVISNDMKIHYAEGKQGLFEANKMIKFWFPLESNFD